jgi:RHS repeat-associated protein
MALVEAHDSSVVSHSYDAFSQLTSASENFGSGTTWTNPYRHDGRYDVRYDGETSLYWMSARAYDPALGRFLSRDPHHLYDQPTGYAATNLSAFANSIIAFSASTAFGSGGVCTGTGAGWLAICASSCTTWAFAAPNCCSSARMSCPT